jgi:hypothetical protein
MSGCLQNKTTIRSHRDGSFEEGSGRTRLISSYQPGYQRAVRNPDNRRMDLKPARGMTYSDFTRMMEERISTVAGSRMRRGGGGGGGSEGIRKKRFFDIFKKQPNF